MKLSGKTKLADLMYGHNGRFMCSLSGRFEPDKYPDAPAIQLCELKCGCWVVGDGNNRIGMILKRNPDATLSDIPEELLSIERKGEWDEELMDWWNPCPKPFGEVMNQPVKKTAAPKNAIYGMIERGDDGKFFATTNSGKKGTPLSALGRSENEARKLLEEKIRAVRKMEKVTLILTPMNAMEDHRCTR